jgi:hypothetical protein
VLSQTSVSEPLTKTDSEAAWAENEIKSMPRFEQSAEAHPLPAERDEVKEGTRRERNAPMVFGTRCLSVPR